MDHPGARSEWLPRGAKTQYHVTTYPCANSQILISSAKTNLVTSDAFGQVVGGELKLSGLVYRYSGAAGWNFDVERNSSRRSTELLLADIPQGERGNKRTTFFLDAQEANEENQDQEFKEKAFDIKEWTIIEHLDTEDVTLYRWGQTEHLLLFVAEFQDELDSFRTMGIPSDSIQFIILRHSAIYSNPATYVRLGTAVIKRNGKDTGLGGNRSL
ncbi:MAG: hypothetical protein Q9218_004094 [Villophora microphyllina]